MWLRALAVWADSNETVDDRPLNFSFYDNGHLFDYSVSWNGAASAHTYYGRFGSGARTYSVEVYSGVSHLPQMSEPVILDVGYASRLNMYLCSFNSSEYSVSGVLYGGEYGSGFAGRPIKIYLNDTVVDTVTTGEYGIFDWTRNFDPGNTSVTYMVQVVYEGQGNATAVLNGTSFDGKPYTRCTTQYCTYKPAANVTQFVVEPETTRDSVPAKSQEEMQKDAEQSGGLTFWHEFSWWYPWYRLHIELHVNPGTSVALNPILPGAEEVTWEDLGFFGALTEEVFLTLTIETAGLIGTWLLARFVAIGAFWQGAIIEGLKIGVQSILFLRDLNDANSMFASALMCFIMIAFGIGDFYATPSFTWRLMWKLLDICKYATGALNSIMMMLVDALQKSIAIHIGNRLLDIIDMGFNFAVAVICLIRGIDLTLGRS